MARNTSLNIVNKAVLAAVLLLGVLAAQGAQAFDFNDVAKAAQTLSTRSYRKPVDNLPKEIKALNYDQYSDITYRQGGTNHTFQSDSDEIRVGVLFNF